MAFAQKGKVTQASSYFTSGKLDQAKQVIDEAIKHEACVNFDRAHFVKGQIYQAIFESQIPDYKKLDPNALDVAWDAFQKVIELDVKGKYTKRLATQYSNLIIDYTNKGVECYNNNQFAEALEAFKRVLEIENSPILTAEAPAKIDTAVTTIMPDRCMPCCHWYCKSRKKMQRLWRCCTRDMNCIRTILTCWYN